MDIFSIMNLTNNVSLGDATVKEVETTATATMNFSAMLQSFSSSYSGNTIAKDDNLQAGSLNVEGKGFEKLNFKTENKAEGTVEKSAETTNVVKEYKDDVVEKISQATGVEVEDVEQAMEELALTVIDLLNPQNLAQLVATITGQEDTVSLLLSTQFSDLMDEITMITDQLADTFNVSTEDLSLLLKDFDFNIPEDVTFEQNLAPMETYDFSDSTTQAEIIDEAIVEIIDETLENGLMNDVEVNTKNPVVEVKTDETKTQKSDLTTDVNNEQVSEDSVPTKTVQVEDRRSDTSRDSKDSSENSFAQHNTNVNAENVNSQSVTTETNFVESYSNIDPLEILEQVTSNLKLTLASDATTMEMQLNPENLGKVFLQLSSKEGAVSAHFMAQNDVVKEVLEAQMADLRENLNQQGVKVDAIEVTVSSHGFERNLDENQHREEKEGEMLEESKKTRRSLRLDSLDQLQGLMSEEEMLVAQMMRDNGNTMDLTA